MFAFNVPPSNHPTNRLISHESLHFYCNLVDVLYNNTLGNLSPYFLGPCIAHRALNPESGDSITQIRPTLIYISIDSRVVGGGSASA